LYTKARGIEFDPYFARYFVMAPPPTEGQKIEYLTHLQYMHSAEAARRAGININTVKKIKARVGAFLVECEEASLPQAKIRALVARMTAINTLIIEHEGRNHFHG
jgi:hypothetical protein